MSLESFSQRMKLRAKNLPREVNKVVRKAALACDQALVLATPVDTGRARSNWIVSLGTDTNSVIEPYDPLTPGTDPGKLGESGNAQAALAQGQAEIAQRKPGQAIHITNNVDYIGRLNEGSSAQAPVMFVQAAIRSGVEAVKGAKIDTGR